MQGIIWANFHALAAANAAGQEVLFVQRSGRTQQAFVAFCGKTGSAAHERNHCSARSQAGQDFPSLKVRTHCFLRWKKLESQPMLGTLVHAVHAQMAFGLMPGDAADRIIPALAAQKAAVTIRAVLGTLHQTKHGPARHDTQQRAQRAQRATPEARDAEIQCNQQDKDQAQPYPQMEVGLLETQQQRTQDEVQYAAGDSEPTHSGCARVRLIPLAGCSPLWGESTDR